MQNIKSASNPYERKNPKINVQKRNKIQKFKIGGHIKKTLVS